MEIAANIDTFNSTQNFSFGMNQSIKPLAEIFRQNGPYQKRKKTPNKKQSPNRLFSKQYFTLRITKIAAVLV